MTPPEAQPIAFYPDCSHRTIERARPSRWGAAPCMAAPEVNRPLGDLSLTRYRFSAAQTLSLASTAIVAAVLGIAVIVDRRR